MVVTIVNSPVCEMDNQQGPTVQHRELCSMLYGSLDGREVWGRMDTRICMAESLRCSPETITTLLIGHTPIQNKNLKLPLLLLSRFSRVRLCTTPWTAAHEAPPSMGFSRQAYWSGVPLPSPAGWRQFM